MAADILGKDILGVMALIYYPLLYPIHSIYIYIDIYTVIPVHTEFSGILTYMLAMRF